MKRSTWIIILVVLGIVVASPPLLRAHDGHDCDIAGAWVGSSPAIPGIYPIPQLITTTITPTDPTGKRLVGVLQPVNTDIGNPFLFPDSDRVPDTVATYVRSGPGTYRFTWIVYYVKSAPPFNRGQILMFFTFSGTTKCLDANTVSMSGVISNWSNVADRDNLHDQDKDDDGLPDAGEVPFFTLPFEFTFNRLPLMTP